MSEIGMKQMRKFFPAALVAVGVSLFVPILLLKCSSPLRSDEAEKGLEPLATVAMRMIGKERPVEFNLKIPDDPVWRRIRKAWGDPSYVIAFVAPAHRPFNQTFIHCFDRLSFGVEVTNYGRAIPLSWMAWGPYGYSEDCQQPEALNFRAAPGSNLRIAVRASPNLAVPAGELTIMPYWTVSTKDRLVGIALDQQLTPGFSMFAALGFVAILFAAVLAVRRRRLASP